VSAMPLVVERPSLIEDEIFWLPEGRLKISWERFPTAINSVGPTPVIVVGNHSHHALTSTEKTLNQLSI
jgi:hypothetical protein